MNIFFLLFIRVKDGYDDRESLAYCWLAIIYLIENFDLCFMNNVLYDV